MSPGSASVGKWLSGLSSLAGKLFGGGSSPFIYLAIAIAIFAAGAGSGWTVNGWRLGTQVAKLEGRLEALIGENARVLAANQRCAIDVHAVNLAVAGIAKASDDLTRSANTAMAKADTAAGKLTASAADILARAPPAPGKECATIDAEQRAYVRERRG